MNRGVHSSQETMNNELWNEKINKAEKALEEALAEYKEAKEAYSENWKKNNPNGSKAELLDYLKEELKEYSEIYKKLVETYHDLDKKIPTLGTNVIDNASEDSEYGDKMKDIMFMRIAIVAKIRCKEEYLAKNLKDILTVGCAIRESRTKGNPSILSVGWNGLHKATDMVPIANLSDAKTPKKNTETIM